MYYADEWLRNLQQRQPPKPVEPVPVASTTWKPFSEMTAEERRKALENREEKKDATPRPAGR